MDTTQLDNTLRSTARAVRKNEAVRAIGLAVAVLLIAALIAIALDAVVGLRPFGLVVVNGLLLTLVVAALGFIVVRIIKQSFDRQRIARLIEDRLQLHHSDLINAVQLADAPADGTSTQLREATIARGTQLAATLVPSRIIDRRPAKIACGYALATLAAIGLAYVLLPSVFRSVIPRYLDPYGDLPPFTLVNFHFDHPAEVYEGKPANIRVKLTGQNLPDQANIVFLDETSDGKTAEIAGSSLPMLKVEGGESSESRVPGTELKGAESERVVDATTTGNPDPGTRSFLLPIDKADRTRVFYVNTPAGRSEKRTIKVLPVPRFEQVTVTYDPPAYTGWPRVVEHLSAKGLSALAGTKATITIKSNLPLEAGELKFDAVDGATGHVIPPLVLTPRQDDPKTVTGELELKASHRFTISLTAANPSRTKSLEPLAGTITVVPDGPPKVRISEPVDRQIIAAEGWKVPVIIDAEDDVAIARLTLFRGVNGFTPSSVDLPLAEKNSRLAQARYTFDLAALGAKAGDTIAFFATAHDNYPGGGRSTDTDTYIIHIISMEDYQSHARSEYRMEEILEEIERFDRLLKELDAKREKLLAEAEALKKKIEDQGGVPTPEDQKKLDELNTKLAEYAEEQWMLAKEMRERSEQPNLYDFERAYAKMLAEQADQLDRGAEDATQLKRENEFNREQKPGDQSEASRHLKKMTDQLKRDESRMDEAQQQAKNAEGDMKKIEQADNIMAQAERVTSIIQQQRDLADRLAPFKNKEKLTPAEELRAQRLAQEQQALKDELSDALKQMEDAAAKAEKELPNMAQSAREIAEAIKALEIEKDQAGAEEAARHGEGQAAHQLAEAAAKKLESLLGQCEGMGEQGQQDFADAGFKLQKQTLGQGLQQLSQSRGLPQMGEGKPGQGTKSGTAGARGSRGKFSVYGPKSAGKDGAERRGGRDGTGRGAGTNSDGSPNVAAESLSPNSAAQRGQGAAAIPGVPTTYRDLAEQYFRRLAEEAK